MMDHINKIGDVDLQKLNILEAVQAGYLNSADFVSIGIADPCVVRIHGITPDNRHGHADFLVDTIELLSIADKFIALVSAIRSAKN